MSVLEEVVQALGVSPAEARRRLARAVAACGGGAGDLAPLLGCSKHQARVHARRAGCRLLRTWELVGSWSL
jgi:hypothetical protein